MDSTEEIFENVRVYAFAGPSPYKDEEGNFVLEVKAAKNESNELFETKLRFSDEEQLNHFVSAIKALEFAEFMPFIDLDENGFHLPLESGDDDEDVALPKYLN